MDLSTATQSDITRLFEAVAEEGRLCLLFLRSEVHTAETIKYNRKPLTVIYNQAKKAAKAIAENELNSGNPTTWTNFTTLDLVTHPAVIVCYLPFNSVYEAANPDNKLTLRQFSSKTRVI